MNERDKELNEVLEELAKNLDITDTEDAAIRLSYQAVGEYLAQEGSSLSEYDVEIFPQGSFNLGTIIRIADWFGIENIVCSMDTADIYNPKVIQATMGSIARVKITYTDLKQYLKQIDKSTPIYGTLLDGKNIYQQELECSNRYCDYLFRI